MVTNLLKSRQPATTDDVDLAHRLVNILHGRNVPGREAVQVDVRGGTVVVSGRLHSKHAKWLCIECCRHVAGVIKLVDEVDVVVPKKKSRAVGS